MPTRRTFLAGAAAAAMVVAAPQSLAEAAPAVAMPVKGYWGITTGDDFYYDLDVANRDEAIAEAAAQYPEGGAAIAWCEPYDVRVPDFREYLTEHMCGCGDTLSEAVVRAAAGINEDADYEGELAEAIEASDTRQILADVRLALDAACIRHGRPDLVGRDFYEEPIDSEDPLLSQLDDDPALEADLQAAGTRWFDRGKFWNEGTRTLHISQQHHLPEPVSTEI